MVKKKDMNTYDSFENSALRTYIKEIRKIPLLNKEEERSLFIEYKKGSKEAKKKLIVSNLRLVCSIASKYYCETINLIDLIQEGNLALIKAIETFDISTDFKFSTYATKVINKDVSRYIQKQCRTIRIPLHLYSYIKKYNVIINNSNGKKYSKEHIAKLMDVNIEVIDNIIKAQSDILSLEEPIDSNDGELMLKDIISYDDPSPEDVILDINTNEDIINLLDCLTEKEKEVIIYRYGLNNGIFLSQKTLAKRLNVSHQRIGNLEIRALEKLKKQIVTKEQIEYYDDYVNLSYLRKKDIK